MSNSAAYVLQPAALEYTLDYKTFVPLFIDVGDIDIPEEPPVKGAHKTSAVVRDVHFPIAMPAMRQTQS